MADLVYAPTQFQIGLDEEATYGTAVASSSVTKRLMITEPSQIDYGNVITDITKKADGSRTMQLNDHFISKAGSDYSATVTGIATDDTLDYLIYGVMQDLVSEASATPYMKIFEWDNASGAVDFSANGGKFFTLHGYSPATDESWQLKSCIISELTLTADPGTNGGRLTYSATFVSGFAPIQTGLSTDPTVWDDYATDFYLFQALNTKTIGGSAVVPSSFSLTLNNAWSRVGFDSSGDAQNYSLGVGGDGLAATGELNVKYDANTKDEVADFLAGTANAIIVQWGDGTADGTLKFEIESHYTGNTMDFGNDAGVFVTLPFMGTGTAASTETIQIDMANTVDRTW